MRRMYGRRPDAQARKSLPTVELRLPLTDAQATAIIVAADRFGVEPWEMAVHILATAWGRVLKGSKYEEG